MGVLSAMKVVGISQCFWGGGGVSVLWRWWAFLSAIGGGGGCLSAMGIVGISQCYGGGGGVLSAMGVVGISSRYGGGGGVFLGAIGAVGISQCYPRWGFVIATGVFGIPQCYGEGWGGGSSVLHMWWAFLSATGGGVGMFLNATCVGDGVLSSTRVVGISQCYRVFLCATGWWAFLSAWGGGGGGGGWMFLSALGVVGISQIYVGCFLVL